MAAIAIVQASKRKRSMTTGLGSQITIVMSCHCCGERMLTIDPFLV